MKLEQITERITASLEERGYSIRRKEIKDESITIDYNECSFKFRFDNDDLKIDTFLKLDYSMTFGRENADYLSSITSYWSIYKHFIMFTYSPQSEEEIESTLEKLLETYE